MNTSTVQYNLSGFSIGVCGCSNEDSRALACECWGESLSETDCCADSVVAYHITTGKVNGERFEGLTVVRIIRDRAQSSDSLLYLDEKATLVQRQLLSDAFQGRLGGNLADIARAMPCSEVKVAPISYSQQGKRASLKLGSFQVRQSMPQVEFSFATS